MGGVSGVFSAPDYDAHQEVVHVRDEESGLRAIIAIHDTALGPALGGCRMYSYADEAEALADVLRLSRGMTFKAALARVRLGGGKSVVIGDPYKQKTDQLLEAMGRAIERLGGRYIVGADIGTNPGDMAVIRRSTNSVSCISEENGGYGDPAPMTALGVFQSLRAAARHRWNSDSLAGRRVAIQGVGNVGYSLAGLLHEAGAELVVCDPRSTAADRAGADFGASVVDIDAIYDVEADIFAPCAMGAIINDNSLARLKVDIIAGAANNQLAEERHGECLRETGITYVPDYVANGGGLVLCAAEWYRSDPSHIEPDVLAIGETARTILEIAADEDISTHSAANRLARQRVREAKTA